VNYTTELFSFLKMHTKLTHGHHRKAETMEEHYQRYVKLYVH